MARSARTHRGQGSQVRGSAASPSLAIGYIRVSTEEQEYGLEAQRASIEAWASRNGLTLVEVFVDDGVSGRTPLQERLGLSSALACLREKRAGVLLAARRDRLARDVVIAALLDREVREAGAVVRTADGVSDLDSPEGVMMRTIVDAVAAYYVERLRANTRAALAVKKSRGELTGSAPYGFKVSPEGGKKLVECPSEQEVISLVHRLRTEGLTIRAIVEVLRGRGVVGRTGRPLNETQVHRLVVRAAA